MDVKYSTALAVRMSDKIRIGGHLSIRGGYGKAAEEARLHCAGAFQYFPKNPRSLAVKDYDKRDASRCKEISSKHGIISVAHTPYPSNLALGQEADAGQYAAVVSSLRNDLEIAESCGSLGIVVHFGTYKKRNPLQGYQNVIQCINEVLSGWGGTAKLLIENQAGDHGMMGMTLEEMVQIRDLCQSPGSIGFCLDSCHAFASGMWRGENDDDFIPRAEQLGYLDALEVIHLNDSRYPVLSRKDRHARVGQGFIGKAGFCSLLSHPVIRTKPMIMESESGEDGTYMEDINRVFEWIEAEQPE